VPTAYTSLLGLALPVEGELSGTWGDVVNDSITSLLDSAVAGTTTITTDADVTLTTTTGVANQARSAVLVWSPASGTVTRTITAPAQSKAYIVVNATGGTQSIKVVGVGPTTGVTIVAGEKCVIAWNGSDFVKVGDFGGDVTFNSVTVTGSVTAGGNVAATGAVSAAADSSFTSTGALLVSSGTTAQRPTGVVGKIRYNSTTNEFEGYSGASPSWKSIGGSTISNDTSTATNVYPLFASATSGTAATLYTSNAKLLYKPSTGEFQSSVVNATNGIVVNSQTVAVSYTIATGSSATSSGPITVASGQSVTVSSGSRWVVL